MNANERDMRKLISKLPLPDLWDTNLLVESVAQTRGRPITLVALDLPNLTQNFCGLWLQRQEDDLLIYDNTTSKYHTAQIIAHEIGHMVLGHGDRPKPDSDCTADKNLNLSEFLPDLDMRTVWTVLGRGRYNENQEHEAELFASLIMVSQAEQELNRPTIKNTIFGSS